MKTKISLAALLLAASSALVACGGGGGGGSVGGPPSVTYTPCPNGFTGTAPNCVAPQTTTTASGKLVDDPSGTPLAGVPVKIEPWIAGATPLPSPQTTTAADGSFSFTAPNGHYLLVIGSDSTSDTTRPTIHVNITLSGGTVSLNAPTLPTIPSVTPPIETAGNYRLITMTANEAQCLTAFNAKRVSLGLGSTVEDEWLGENIRNIQAYGTNPTLPAVVLPGLTGGNAGVGPGGASSDCSNLISVAFDGLSPMAVDPHALWSAGAWTNYQSLGVTQSRGVIEFPLDPRYKADPLLPIWP